MSVHLNSLLEFALQVPQSILRCGDGLIHGRVNMMNDAHMSSGHVHSLFRFYNIQQNINMVF